MTIIVISDMKFKVSGQPSFKVQLLHHINFLSIKIKEKINEYENKMLHFALIFVNISLYILILNEIID